MNNDTTVNVQINATDSSRDVVNNAANNFSNLWKQVAAGQIAAQLAQQAFNAIVGTVGNAVSTAGNFQQQLTMLVTGAGESQKNLKLVGDGIKQIAIDTGTTLDQLTSGAYQIESAGFHGADALNILKMAAEGAKADGADLGTVTNALTTIMHDYNIPASQAAQVTDQMVAAVARGKMHMQDFAGSLSTVLPFANQVGLSFSQVAGAEATLTAGGVSADQATQDLLSIIRSLTAPTKQQVEAMQQMGLDSVSLSQNLGKDGLTGTLKEMFDAVTAHMGPDGLVLQSALQNATLATQDMNKEMGALPPQVQTLAKQLVDGTISFTDYRKAARALPEDMTNLAQQFEGTYNKAHSFNQQLLNGVNASPTFAAELKAMTGQTDAMNSVMMLTGSNFGTFQNNVNAVADAAKGGSKNISDWSIIQSTFNQKWAEFQERMQVGAETIGEKLLPIVGNLITFVEKASDALGKFADAFSHNKDDIQVIAGVIGALLIPALVALSIQAAKTAADMIASAAQATASWIASAAQTYAGWITSFAQMSIDIGKSALDLGGQAISTAGTWISQASSIASGWATSFAGMVKNGASAVTSFTKNALESAGAWIAAAHDSELGVGGTIAKMINDWNLAASAAIKNAVLSSAAWIKNAAVSSYAWVSVELPKIIQSFLLTSASATANALVASAKWVASAVASSAAWIAQTAVMIAKQVAVAAAAVIQAAIAAAQWVAAAVKAGAYAIAIDAAKTSTYLLGSATVATGALIAGVFAGLAIDAYLVVKAIQAIQDALNAVSSANKSVVNAADQGQSITDIMNQYKAGKITKTQETNAINALLQGVDSAVGQSGSISLFGQLQHRAMGGSVNADQPYIVGENGMELFVPSSSGTIIPSGQTQQIINNDRSNTATVTIGQVVLASDSAVQEFFKQIDRDTQLQSMGLSPARGIA